MTLTGKDMLELLEKYLPNEKIDTESADFYIQFEMEFETSEHPYIAISRMNRAAIKTIGLQAIPDLLEHWLQTETNWRKLTSKELIAKSKQWWLENMKTYGYEAPPDLPAWRE